MSRIFLFYLFFDMFPVFFNTRNKEFCEVILREHIAFGIVANYAGKLRISRHPLVYLEEFAPDVERSEFERRVGLLGGWKSGAAKHHDGVFNALRMLINFRFEHFKLHANAPYFAPQQKLWVCEREPVGIGLQWRVVAGK